MQCVYSYLKKSWVLVLTPVFKYEPSPILSGFQNPGPSWCKPKQTQPKFYFWSGWPCSLGFGPTQAVVWIYELKSRSHPFWLSWDLRSSQSQPELPGFPSSQTTFQKDGCKFSLLIYDDVLICLYMIRIIPTLTRVLFISIIDTKSCEFGRRDSYPHVTCSCVLTCSCVQLHRLDIKLKIFTCSCGGQLHRLYIKLKIKENGRYGRSVWNSSAHN